jgi:uncharacterized protein (TIGR00725 family)
MARLPIVGVMGSGSESHPDLARPLGAWLASQPVHLLTGGGGGVMAEVGRAFAAVSGRAGLVIGILPAAGPESPRPPSGYPNEWVELPIVTHLHQLGSAGRGALSRNHLNVLSSDLILALPGGAGTASEVALAVAYARPILAFVRTRGDIPALPAEVASVSNLDEVEAFVRSVLRL